MNKREALFAIHTPQFQKIGTNNFPDSKVGGPLQLLLLLYFL